MRMRDVMLDLETFGNGPRSVIVAIGAVFFGNGELGDEFYRRVDAESCVRAGLVMDADTVRWWLRQSAEARAAVSDPDDAGDPLKEALDAFAWFVGARGLGGVCKGVRVWGNGAAFDNVILASGYRALRNPQPWRFCNDRCYRTAKELARHVPMAKRVGTHHNALDDARSQAIHLMEIFEHPRNAAIMPYYAESEGTKAPFLGRFMRRIFARR